MATKLKFTWRPTEIILLNVKKTLKKKRNDLEGSI